MCLLTVTTAKVSKCYYARYSSFTNDCVIEKCKKLESFLRSGLQLYFKTNQADRGKTDL